MVELVGMELIVIRALVLMAIPDQTVKQVNILFITKHLWGEPFEGEH